ncbi:MAG: 3-isopropylmalate dehydratase large subunit [archaeon]|nr:3-isopropylmalate dehydratase large subunit [archaeon]
MSMTITEKILANHSENEKVDPGQLINAKLDIILAHDITTPPAISMLKEHNMDKVFDPKKIIVAPDHFVPNKDIKSAELAKRLREWVTHQNIENYYEIGRHGVCHAILPEQGHVLPGTTIVCGDSHTCTHGALGAFATGIGSTDLAAAIATGELWFKVPGTMRFQIDGKLQKGVYSKDIILNVIQDIGVDGALYKAMEFWGSTIDSLSIEARMTITNMAIEAGAKTGIIEPDQKTKDYLKNRTKKPYSVVKSDKDADYESARCYNASEIVPTVAMPNLPSNGKPAKELEKQNIHLDQVYIGSCTNGRIEDLRIAANILRGSKTKKGTRLIVVPATTDVWMQAKSEGLFDIFNEAGAAISTPTCGACLGGYMGVLAKGEACLSTTNRNFTGRMGHHGSKVYLASPATAAASAIEGIIADPANYM